MATWEDIETRVISGRGSIRFPSGEDEKWRAYRLYIQVVRPPKNRYKNFKFPQPREFFGNAMFYKDLYVYETRTLEWTTEFWQFVPDICSQNLIAIKCLYDLLVAASNGLILTGNILLPPFENVIKDYTYLTIAFDRIVFEMYNQCAIEVRLSGLKHDTCNPINDKPQPPDDPAPADRDPPDSDDPIDVTPPYDGDDVDDLFDPFPEDPVDDGFPFGDSCVEYDVTIEITTFSAEILTQTYRLFGKIDGAGIGGDGAFVFIIAQGGRDSIDPVAPECLPTSQPCAVFGSTEPTYSSVVIISIAEV